MRLEEKKEIIGTDQKSRDTGVFFCVPAFCGGDKTKQGNLEAFTLSE